MPAPARSTAARLSPAQRSALLIGSFAAVPAVVVGVTLAVTAGWLYALIAFVVVAVVAGIWATQAGDRAALAGVEWAPADPVAHARLFNLVEGLCTAAGTGFPRLVVADQPGLNALAAGSRPGRAVVGVTSALLAELERVELEGVLAEALWLIRHEETRPVTVLAGVFGLGAGLAIGPGRDSAADRGAVSLTRYPPALASALEKIRSKGGEVSGVSSRAAALWLAEPLPASGRRPGRLSLDARIEALTEL